MSYRITDVFDTYNMNNVNVIRAHAECDTFSDLPPLQLETLLFMGIGSTAHVIATNKLYAMQTGGAWIEQDEAARMDVYTSGQVDALLSEKIGFPYGVEIIAETPGAADLNDYTTRGTYHSTAASAQNTLNTPKSPNGAITGYRLDVLQLSETLCTQILRTNGAECYIFVRNQTTTGFTPWYNLNEWGLARGIAANSNLNDYTEPGEFYCGATTAGTLTNNPAGASAIKLRVEYLNNTNRFIQTLTPAKNGAFEYYKRQFTSSGWQPWAKFTGVSV
jgi:hypothetical protein